MTSILVRLAAFSLPAILAAASAAARTETVIHVDHRGNIGAGVVVSDTGFVYGYAPALRFPHPPSGQGVIYRLVPPAHGRTNWLTNYIHVFSGGTTDGRIPVSHPVFYGHDALVGATQSGGTYGQGVAFKLTETAPGSDIWTYAVIHNFGPPDGTGTQNQPASLMLGANGILYGTSVTTGTGSGDCLGSCGTVFSLTPPASGKTAWTYQTLYTFQGGADGDYPAATPVQDAAGALYGNTQFDGSDTTSCFDHHGCGTIYQLVPPKQGQTDWTKTTLYTFSPGPQSGGGPDGGEPSGSLTLGPGGIVYGATVWGGSQDNMSGVVFVLQPPAAQQESWSQSVIFEFFSLVSQTGCHPNGGLLLGDEGTLLGTTSNCASAGVVFRLLPPKPNSDQWAETLIHDFVASADGAFPNSGLTRDRFGSLFGTTLRGGSDGLIGDGTAYKVSP